MYQGVLNMTLLKKFLPSVKKFVSAALVAATFCLCFGQADAAEYSTQMGGNGYAESRRAPSIAPAVALGTIALVAIVAIALQNQHGGHGHSH